MLTEKEKELLTRIVCNVISNGNTVNPTSISPTPKEYKLLHRILNKINE